MTDNRRNLLLVGNGLNRLSGEYSWEKLLKDLAEEMGLNRDIIDNQAGTPFTLLFERICLKSEKQSDEELKKLIADKLLEHRIKPNEFHEKFMSLPVEHILTTNYDYNLEQAFSIGKDNCFGKSKGESKYSLFRNKICNNKFIWHIHGEADKPNTITLGYDHYIGYIQKIRNFFTYGIGSKKKKLKGIFRINKTTRIDCERAVKKINSWVEWFLVSNVHIVGFSLDFSEIVLWWVITFKQKLKRRRQQCIGDTIYHFFKKSNQKLSDRERSKINLLESIGVNVHSHEIYCSEDECNYKEGYKEILEILKERFESIATF